MVGVWAPPDEQDGNKSVVSCHALGTVSGVFGPASFRRLRKSFAFDFFLQFNYCFGECLINLQGVSSKLRIESRSCPTLMEIVQNNPALSRDPL